MLAVFDEVHIAMIDEEHGTLHVDRNGCVVKASSDPDNALCIHERVKISYFLLVECFVCGQRSSFILKALCL